MINVLRAQIVNLLPVVKKKTRLSGLNYLYFSKERFLSAGKIQVN